MSLFLQPLFGGSLIGAAAALLLVANGRIAGISGITKGLLSTRGHERFWRAAFVLGLVGGGLVMMLAYPQAFASSGLTSAYLVLAGLFVGVGTSLANGCTSGHGICGLSRFSKRSFAATATFMAFGVLAALLSRHVLGIGGAS